MKIKFNDLKVVSDNINLDEYIAFRESVKKKMKHPEWLGDFSYDDLQNILMNNGKIWIYYDKLIPVCSMMSIPADAKALKKFDIDLDFKDVLDYGPMFVNFDYIGNGFQHEMLKELDKYAKENNKKYAIVTIHPDNIYSINNIAKDSFKLHGQKVFNRGIRNIYIKEL